MSNIRDNMRIQGKYLDHAEDSSEAMYKDLYPDVSTEFLADWERVYNLKSTGTDAVRQARIQSAMNQRGGLSKAYFEKIGNLLGGGIYTVSIAEGSDALPFIVAPYSPETDPQGPATLIPGAITPGGSNNCYYITVTVTGSSSETELEDLYDRLKPPWTIWNYVYIP